MLTGELLGLRPGEAGVVFVFDDEIDRSASTLSLVRGPRGDSMARHAETRSGPFRVGDLDSGPHTIMAVAFDPSASSGEAGIAAGRRTFGEVDIVEDKEAHVTLSLKE